MRLHEPRGEEGGLPAGSVEVRPIRSHQDGRGSVFEPVDPGTLGRQRNVHVVITRPGCTRGNHVHRRGTEVLVVQGPALVRYVDRQGSRDVEVRSGDVFSFTIPAGVPHAVRNTGTQANLLVAFRDVAFDPEAPDTDSAPLLDPES